MNFLNFLVLLFIAYNISLIEGITSHHHGHAAMPAYDQYSHRHYEEHNER